VSTSRPGSRTTCGRTTSSPIGRLAKERSSG
jgi:hypothetical protein